MNLSTNGKKETKMKNYIVEGKGFSGQRKMVTVEAMNKDEAKSKARKKEFINKITSVSQVK